MLIVASSFLVVQDVDVLMVLWRSDDGGQTGPRVWKSIGRPRLMRTECVDSNATNTIHWKCFLLTEHLIAVRALQGGHSLPQPVEFVSTGRHHRCTSVWIRWRTWAKAVCSQGRNQPASVGCWEKSHCVPGKQVYSLPSCKWVEMAERGQGRAARTDRSPNFAVNFAMFSLIIHQRPFKFIFTLHNPFYREIRTLAQ